MTSQPLPTSPSSTADARAAELSRHRRVLNEMIDAGAELMQVMLQDVRALAAAADGLKPVAGPEVAEVYDRVSRSVRRSIMTVQRLAEEADGQTGPRRADGGADQRVARRQIIRAVEDDIEARSSGGEAESLVAELHERLDGPELDDEIGRRPVADIIKDVRRDLGLVQRGLIPYKRRTPADVSVLCARAARADAAEIARLDECARADERRGWPEAASARFEEDYGEALLLRERSLDDVIAELQASPPVLGIALGSREPPAVDDG